MAITSVPIWSSVSCDMCLFIRLRIDNRHRLGCLAIVFMFALHNPKAPCGRLDGSELWQARKYRVRFVARNSATVKPIEPPRSQSIVDRPPETVSGVCLDAGTPASRKAVARGQLREAA